MFLRFFQGGTERFLNGKKSYITKCLKAGQSLLRALNPCFYGKFDFLKDQYILM
jgi:hypothetical protein